MKTLFPRHIKLALAFLASFVFGLPASAVTIGAIWDPMFGGNLNGDLWWSGQAQFSLPDDCVTQAPTGDGPFFVANGSTISDTTCLMQLDFASVTLYNNPPGPAGGTSLYSFGVDDFCCGSEGMWIKDVGGTNAVVGIQTEDYSFLSLAPDSTSGGVYSGPLWLWFTSPPGGEFDPAFGSTQPVCVISGEEGTLIFPCGNPADHDSDPAFLRSLTTCFDGDCVTVSIPEPGTFALGLGALAALLLARRRTVTTA